MFPSSLILFIFVYECLKSIPIEKRFDLPGSIMYRNPNPIFMDVPLPFIDSLIDSVSLSK